MMILIIDFFKCNLDKWIKPQIFVKKIKQIYTFVSCNMQFDCTKILFKRTGPRRTPVPIIIIIRIVTGERIPTWTIFIKLVAKSTDTKSCPGTQGLHKENEEEITESLLHIETLPYQFRKERDTRVHDKGKKGVVDTPKVPLLKSNFKIWNFAVEHQLRAESSPACTLPWPRWQPWTTCWTLEAPPSHRLTTNWHGIHCRQSPCCKRGGGLVDVPR